jgi:UDP-N-acetyl-D-galactosamine dehydrogenase
VNIALVNELALIFNRLGIDTQEVLEAAGSKWNFLPFRPGLVGGHCIGVDPYYLTHKAQQIGYHPEMILAGRRINDNMALYVAGEVVRLMLAKRIHVNESRILVMGLAFKENTPDLRNSKVAELVAELKNHGAKVDVWDPWVSAKEAGREYGIKLLKRPTRGRYDAIVLAVGHREFAAMRAAEIRGLARRKHVIYDIKYLLDRTQADGRL